MTMPGIEGVIMTVLIVGGGIGGLTPALDPGIDEQIMFYPTRAQ